MSKTQFIDQKKLEDISLQARQSPRLRKNYNFHHADHAICHRLLNAMEPDSYIQPHRHLDINKDETLIVVRGRMAIIIFNDADEIEEKSILEPGGDVLMANIPHGVYHTWLSLKERSVFFEAKGGPFLPLTQDEKAPWAPEEGKESAQAYLAALKKLF
jgi:cupin fold WbuC family metalloprotein